jgi:hypothetical protein
MPAFSVHRGLAKKEMHYLVRRSDDVSADQLGTGLGGLSRKPPQSEGVVLTEGIEPPAEDVSLEDVYRAPEFGTVELTSALALLRDVIEWCNRALAALVRAEVLQADDAMVNVQVRMPELFCCRAVGDGLGEVVNAVQCSFENLSGRPMERSQIEAVRNAFVAVRSEPRISFDRAINLVSAMEQAGLAVDPAPIEALADWLDA